jgi:16S rRNA (adenine1518-N6/adenine1519-N6)-dimethyltransferase
MSPPAHRPRKRFGQHFLVQPQLAQRIVALAELRDGDTVLEIGPGRGALTSLLANAVRKLYLIEIDRDLHAVLSERFAASPQVHVIAADALRVDYASLLAAVAPVVVVANLPYNIATPLLMRLLETPHLFTRLIVMVQREIADRLAAAPGTKSYGALSVMFQLSLPPSSVVSSTSCGAWSAPRLRNVANSSATRWRRSARMHTGR